MKGASAFPYKTTVVDPIKIPCQGYDKATSGWPAYANVFGSLTEHFPLKRLPDEDQGLPSRLKVFNMEKNTMKKIKVLIADDHEIMRMGLATMLETDPSITVVAEAADGVEAINKT